MMVVVLVLLLRCGCNILAQDSFFDKEKDEMQADFKQIFRACFWGF
jgi:hypothetical protein